MNYIILGMGLFFILIGQILTPANARYLLSGYNTMSEAERSKVDIVGYVAWFKKFHWILGGTFIGFGLMFQQAAGGMASGIFLAVYPILAYMYFLWNSQQYYKGDRKSNIKVGMAVLAATLLLVGVLFMAGLQPGEMRVSQNQIEISGMYGETINTKSIARLRLLEELPEIGMKKNGFAMGQVNKGYFNTKGGETVKLLLDNLQEPFIFIEKKDGQKIYFSADGQSSQELYRQIIEAAPDLSGL